MAKYLKFVLLFALIVTVFTVGASAKLLLIDNMDDKTPWSGVNVVPETENIKEGTGAMRSSLAAGADGENTYVLMQRNFKEPLDLSMYEDDGVVSAWVYVDDVDLFKDPGQWEWTSSGTCDIEESSINLQTFYFETGWNYLMFPIDDFELHDADWTRINFIRIFKFSAGPNYWIVDDIRIGLRSDYGMGKVKLKDTATMFETFDEGFENIDDFYNIEGTGCATASTEGDLMQISRVYETPIDISRIKDFGFVYVWIYVENGAAITDGQLELTSSGKPDVEELSWTFPAAFEFKDGWNELLLEVDPNTECNLAAVNFMRLYLFTSEPNTMKIDKLMVGEGPDFGKMPVTEPPTQAETDPPANPGENNPTGENNGNETPNDEPSDNTVLFIIIGVVAAVIIAVVIIIAISSKKKK